MKNLIILSLSTLLAVGISSCDISDNEISPEENFLKIYDDQSFSASYLPIDIQEVEDGYLILAAQRIETSNFPGTYLLKVDGQGDVVMEKPLDDNLVQPVKNLMKIGELYYFIAMDAITLQANLISVTADSLKTTSTALGGLSYPLAVSEDNGEIIFLSYNNDDKNSILSLITSDGVIAAQEAFSIGAGSEVEAPIIEHFTRSGRQLPFFTGRAGGLLYFNGFSNYTLSLVFTDLNGSGVDGVLQGQQDDGGVSAAMHLGGTNFSLSRFNFGDNFISPNSNVNVQGITSITDLGGNPFPELVADAPMHLESITLNSQEISLFGSNTKSGQVVLLAFASNGEFLGSHYLGYSDPYTLAGFSQTEDEGLVITGSVAVAGRFDRIFVNKLSKAQLQSIVN